MKSIRPRSGREVDRRDARGQHAVMSEHAHGSDEGAPGEWRKLALLAATSGVLGLLSLVAERFGEAGATWALVFVAGAWIVGAQWEGALLLFLFSTAGAIEHYAMDRTRGAIAVSYTHLTLPTIYSV